MKDRQERIDEYFATKALSSGNLADFFIAPDMVLLEIEDKPCFAEGRALELMIEDRAKGSSLFGESFFIADIEGAVPSNILKWIADDDLDEHYVYTKSNELSKQHATRHKWLDACKENPGRRPLSKEIYEQLKSMIDNLWKAEANVLDVASKQYHRVKMGTLLEHGSFQVPYYWEYQGHKKKALFDVISFMNFNGSVQVIHIDIKKTATYNQFKTFFRSKYWLQDRHYTEGMMHLAEEKNILSEPFMLFLSACMEKPHLAQCFRLDDESIEYADEVYSTLCYDYAEWEKQGMQPRGWREQEAIRIYF
jgi:hypothetical protein